MRKYCSGSCRSTVSAARSPISCCEGNGVFDFPDSTKFFWAKPSTTRSANGLFRRRVHRDRQQRDRKRHPSHRRRQEELALHRPTCATCDVLTRLPKMTTSQITKSPRKRGTGHGGKGTHRKPLHKLRSSMAMQSIPPGIRQPAPSTQTARSWAYRLRRTRSTPSLNAPQHRCQSPAGSDISDPSRTSGECVKKCSGAYSKVSSQRCPNSLHKTAYNWRGATMAGAWRLEMELHPAASG